jgi:hypothetical protein
MWRQAANALLHSHARGRWFDPSRAHLERPWKRGLSSWTALLGASFASPCETLDAALAHASLVPLTLPDDEDFCGFWKSWLAYLRQAATEGGGARIC